MPPQKNPGVEWLLRLLLIVGSSLIGLYAIEFFGVLIAPASSQLNSVKAAKRLGISFDQRDMSEFIRDMNEDGRQVVPAFSPEIWLSDFLQEGTAQPIFPFSGIATMLTAGYNENGDRPVYLSDQFGFNNPAATYQEPVDIVLAGDSYTAGITVQSEESIAGHLRKADYNVLNLGANANGPLIELGTLVEYAQAEEPPIVIWLFYEGNDLYNLSREKQHPMLMAYLEDPKYRQNLRDRQPEIDEKVSLRIAALEQEKQREDDRDHHPPINLADIVKLTRTRKAISISLNHQAADNLYEEADENIALFAAVLERANELVNSWNGELYFAYLPMYQRFSSNNLTKSKLETRRESVLNEVDRLGVQSIDMAAQFEQVSDPLQLFPFGLFGHYNARGYKIVADEILIELPAN